MAARNLLHKTKIPEFKSWLTLKGFEWREGGGNWQLMQIKRKESNVWDVIYERLKMPEHVTVTGPLVNLVQQFIKENSHVIKPRNTVREASTEEATPGARHTCGESSLPWDS